MTEDIELIKNEVRIGTETYRVGEEWRKHFFGC